MYKLNMFAYLMDQKHLDEPFTKGLQGVTGSLRSWPASSNVRDPLSESLVDVQNVTKN